MESKTSTFNVKLFADGADLSGMIEMARKPYISGLTTNPTLMKKAGITNYKEFATRLSYMSSFVKLQKPNQYMRVNNQA